MDLEIYNKELSKKKDFRDTHSRAMKKFNQMNITTKATKAEKIVSENIKLNYMVIGMNLMLEDQLMKRCNDLDEINGLKQENEDLAVMLDKTISEIGKYDEKLAKEYDEEVKSIKENSHKKVSSNKNLRYASLLRECYQSLIIDNEICSEIAISDK